MKNKIIAILMVLMMSFTCFACVNKDGAITGNESSKGQGNSTDKYQLQLLKADNGITAEDLLSKIKSEYLITNNGYSDDDEISVILSLSEPSIIEEFNSTNNDSYTVVDYTATPAGQSVARKIETQQNRTIKNLTDAGLINEVIYTYSTITNASFSDISRR